MATMTQSGAVRPRTGEQDRRWFGVGHSADTDSLRAGEQATQDATGGREATLLIVFASPFHDRALLLDGVRRHAGPGTRIVGCTTSGQIVPGKAVENSVAVAALGGPGFDVRVAVGRDVTGRGHEAGVEAAGCVHDVQGTSTALMLLVDGLTAAQQDITRGAYAVAGPRVPLIGGYAGDDGTFGGTYQFAGDVNGVEVLTDAVIAVAIGSDAPMAVAVDHGWRKTGRALVVTRSQGSAILMLDDRPALDVYLEETGVPPAIVADEEAFRRYLLSHPLGLLRRKGEEIRAIYAVDPVERSLLCYWDVPQGTLAWLLTADAGAVLASAEVATATAVGKLDGHPLLGVLTFDCAVRKFILGDEGIATEIAGFAAGSGGAPVAGFYANGEICRISGARSLHQLTVVTFAFA